MRYPLAFPVFHSISCLSHTGRTEGFRVNKIIRQKLAKSKRRIQRRLDKADVRGGAQPMMTARNIKYEIADRTRGLAYGGIGAMHLLARKIGLIDAINQGLTIFKVHLPYHESDHVLNIAYNALCNGTCMQDIELRRNDVVSSMPSAPVAFPIQRLLVISAVVFKPDRCTP